MNSRRRINAGDPQRAELTLALAPITVRILAGLNDCLLGNAIKLTAGTIVTLGLAKDPFVTGFYHHPSFNSCHRL